METIKNRYNIGDMVWFVDTEMMPNELNYGRVTEVIRGNFFRKTKYKIVYQYLNYAEIYETDILRLTFSSIKQIFNSSHEEALKRLEKLDSHD